MFVFIGNTSAAIKGQRRRVCGILKCYWRGDRPPSFGIGRCLASQPPNFVRDSDTCSIMSVLTVINRKSIELI